MKLACIALSLLLSFASFAGDHPMSEIIGKDIKLSTKDHTIAGRVGTKLIFGDVEESKGHKNSTLTIKSDDGLITTSFGNQNGHWGGVVGTANSTTEIKLVRIDREIPAYIISVGGKEHTIRVEAEDFRNNHFINPKYVLETTQGDIEAKMVEGQACWMYSLHLIFMIFGTYLI